ncbi:MAG: VWA domain-containing protein [Proteobacteria bacterium]|nr:VWA domain-containing protein [Pseudomonadota bacterium]
MPVGLISDVALDATLRATAARRLTHPRGPITVRPEDLREKIRRHRSPYFIVFVVDNSWSIHVDTSLERTKGVVLELLKDARIHHDKVAMVAFRHNRRPDSTICLPPTNSYTRAAECLQKIPLSGSTPLPDAISKAYHLLRQTLIKYQNAIPAIVIITDGIANIPIRPGGDPYDEIFRLCRHLKWGNIATVIVDTEPTRSEAAGNHCRQMAVASGGTYLTLSELTRQSIEEAVAGIVGTRSPHSHECF